MAVALERQAFTFNSNTSSVTENNLTCHSVMQKEEEKVWHIVTTSVKRHRQSTNLKLSK